MVKRLLSYYFVNFSVFRYENLKKYAKKGFLERVLASKSLFLPSKILIKVKREFLNNFWLPSLPQFTEILSKTSQTFVTASFLLFFHQIFSFLSTTTWRSCQISIILQKHNKLNYQISLPNKIQSAH